MYHILFQVKILYVRNLMLSTTEEEIRHGFENGRLGIIERVKKMKDYAFVHFTDRSFALEVFLCSFSFCFQIEMLALQGIISE